MVDSLILKILSSKKLALILMAIYSLLIASATIIEKVQSTEVAKALIYYSPLFIFLQLFMVINFIFVTIRYKLIAKNKISYLLVHAAFIVILIGATITHLTSQEGLMHIREGNGSNQFVYKTQGTYKTINLPFYIELIDFKIERYPGSQSPSSYESNLRIHENDRVFEKRVFMNNVLDLNGYRFYQASYDQDEMGTILSVNYDVPGRIVTYIGYMLLIISSSVFLFDKHSRFRKLWYKLEHKVDFDDDNINKNKDKKFSKALNKTQKALSLCALALVLGATTISPKVMAFDKVATISKDHASLFGTLALQSTNGRIEPINTFGNEFIRKFKATSLLNGNTHEQILLSIMIYPKDWAVTELIEIKDPNIIKRYGFTNKKRISYKDAFDENGRYRLAKDVEAIYLKNPAQRNHTDREILKLDDKINILNELLQHRLLRIFPKKGDVNNRWLSLGERELFASNVDFDEAYLLLSSYLIAIKDAQISNNWTDANKKLQDLKDYQIKNSPTNLISKDKLLIERLYNILDLNLYIKFLYLALGLLMSIAFFKDKKSKTNKKKCLSFKNILTFLSLLLFFAHSVSLVMRWYISGYAPWSNSYETMVFLSWAGVFCGFIFVKRNYLVAALAILFGGIVLLISTMSWMDPQITPLVPVLKSPWLLAHVAILIISYGFLGLCCMIGTAQLCLSCIHNKKYTFILSQMTIINELSMILGTALLAIGIFLGAVWANESWGRYWSWDPKESWALISLIVYAIVLHIRWVASKSDYIFNTLSVHAFLSILMTFLGVNYFLNGMHSYGSNDALSSIPFYIYIAFIVFFILPCSLAYIRQKHKN